MILDGKKIGEVRNGETREFAIFAGQHELSMKVDWCGSKRIKFIVGDSDVRVFHAKSNLRGPKLLGAVWYALFAPKSWVLLEQTS